MNNVIQRCTTSLILLLLLGTSWIMPLFMVLLLIISLVYILIFEWPRLAKNSLFLWLLTPFYIIIPFLSFITLNLSPERDLLFLFILIIATFDTGSYISGKLFGKHLLCPNISPKKTIEGLLGGFVTAYIVGSLLYFMRYNMPFLPPLHILLLFFICSVALCGDLFESWLKRKAGLKDSGCLLPGHGGLLDRFDSYLWASYFLLAIKKLD